MQNASCSNYVIPSSIFTSRAEMTANYKVYKYSIIFDATYTRCIYHRSGYMVSCTLQVTVIDVLDFL